MRAITKIRVKYSKNRDVCMLSHLEVVAIVKNSVEKSGLPVCLRGENKKLCIAFGPPLPVGYSSLCELFDVEMQQRVEPESAKQAFSKNIPSGFEVKSVYGVPVFSPPVDTAVNAAEYMVSNLKNIENGDLKIREFYSKNEYLIERITDKSAHTIDVRPLVKEIKFVENGIFLLLRFGPKRTIKPDVLIPKIFSLNEEQKMSMRIERIAFYCEKEDGVLRSV